MQSGKELSVIIPVHDWDVNPLIKALAREITGKGLMDQVEVLVADDCSQQQYRVKNSAAINQHSFCQYFELDQRLGRSGIRNFLIRKSRRPQVLLLDSDMLPDRDDFLTTYLEQVGPVPKVFCGGYSYKTRILPGPEYDFYVYKGRRTEELPAEERNRTPWRYLFTGNVLVPREALDAIDFDERFVGYGYEDIEWAIRLSARYPIEHIDNTCSHLGLVEKNGAFQRMRGSIANFRRLAQLHPELFAMTGAARMARILSVLPRFLLRGGDRLLAGFFRLLPGNFLCFYLFQLDKAVLLALNHGGGGRDDE